MKNSIVLILLIPLCLAGTAMADSWHIETVDSTGDVGYFSSLAMDSNDHPHISYVGNGQVDVKHAYWNGSSWVTEVVSSEGPSDCTSIVIDSNDYPVICYRKYTGLDALRYARFDGSNWLLSTIDASGATTGLWNSMRMDNNDVPFLSYLWEDYGTGKILKYAYYDDGWVILTPAIADEIGEYSSLAFDSGGHPHISCYDATQDGLIEVYRPYGTYWAVSWIDVAGDSVGLWTSLAIDSQDHRHISYYDGTNGALKYAYYNGSSWSISTIDNTAVSIGFCTSIAVDSDDHPHISYYSPSSGGLRYAYYNGSSWSTTIIDSEWMTGWHSSLKINSDGNPCISYYGNGDLRYAWYGPDTGIESQEEALPSISQMSVYPNPSSITAVVNFNLNRSGQVVLDIYGLDGRRVEQPLNGFCSEGVQQVTIGSLPTGMYIAQLQSGDTVERERFLVIQ